MLDIRRFPRGGLWIPSKNSQSNWLLMALHGSGGSCKDFSGLEDIFNLSDLNYLYLNGFIPTYSGFRWYSGLEGRDACYAGIHSFLNYTASMGYPSSRTFLMGFSQGASLAIESSVRYPRLLAGYIGISGRIENLPGLLSKGNPEIIQKGKWLLTHGTRDFNLSVGIIRNQVMQMQEFGFNVDYREYDKIHEFDHMNELPEIRNWIRSRMK